MDGLNVKWFLMFLKVCIDEIAVIECFFLEKHLVNKFQIYNDVFQNEVVAQVRGTEKPETQIVHRSLTTNQCTRCPRAAFGSRIINV